MDDLASHTYTRTSHTYTHTHHSHKQKKRLKCVVPGDLDTFHELIPSPALSSSALYMCEQHYSIPYITHTPTHTKADVVLCAMSTYKLM
jgi:hypothetical protein